MTLRHTRTERPALPIPAVGRAFSFSFRQPYRCPTDRNALGAHAVALKIHNMNVFDVSEKKRVHIMNFLADDQTPIREIHIMNFLKKVAPSLVRWTPGRAGKAGAPSTYKGARNVMS
jgi:hypothetical protein